VQTLEGTSRDEFGGGQQVASGIVAEHRPVAREPQERRQGEDQDERDGCQIRPPERRRRPGRRGRGRRSLSRRVYASIPPSWWSDALGDGRDRPLPRKDRLHSPRDDNDAPPPDAAATRRGEAPDGPHAPFSTVLRMRKHISCSRLLSSRSPGPEKATGILRRFVNRAGEENARSSFTNLQEVHKLAEACRGTLPDPSDSEWAC
jgi:hypothetical protein